MTLSRVAGATTTESTSGTDHSITIGTVLNNDWLIVGLPYASGSRTVTQTAGNALTEILAPGATQSGATFRLYKRKLTALDSGTTFTLQTSGAGLKCAMPWEIWRGGNTTDIVGDVDLQPLASGATHTSPLIAASAAYGVPLLFVADFKGVPTNTALWTAPTGFTKSSENFCTGTVSLTSAAVAYRTGLTPVSAGAPVGGAVWTADQSAFAAAATIVLRPTNVPPVGSAGINQSAGISQLVTLAGDDSDEDGTISTRLWTQVSGPTVTLSNTAIKAPTFTPTVAGAYVFQYVVTDNSGDTSAPSQVTVFVATATPRPSSVISAGTWTNVGGAANIAAALADESDTTYAESVANPAGAPFTVAMDGFAVGQETWNSTKVSKSDNSSNVDLLVELMCGATVVDSVTVSLTTTPTTTPTRTLNSTQRALITDRNNMRLRYTATTV